MNIKKEKNKNIPVKKTTWKKLSLMKIDLTDGGTFDDLLQKFIEREGY